MIQFDVKNIPTEIETPDLVFAANAVIEALYKLKVDTVPLPDPVTGADSGDCGHGFRLNATMRSDRRRPPVPTKAAGVSLPA